MNKKENTYAAEHHPPAWTIIGGRLPLDEYRRVMETSPLVTVDVLFLSPDKKRILLGKRTNEPYAGEFYSFGSRMFKNEEFEACAIRVAFEELGLTLQASDLTYIGALNEINTSSIFENVNYHAVDIYFYCIVDDSLTSLDSQHSEVRWFSLDDAKIHPNVQKRIEGLQRVLRT